MFQILRYHKITPGKGIFFRKSEERKLETFTDANWARSIEDRRSTSSYCTFVWGNLVTWRSMKQSMVAKSSTKAKFKAMALGIWQLIWLERPLGELHLTTTNPMLLYYDNKATISIARNPIHHDRTKHVEVDRHFIKEKIEGGMLNVEYVPTRERVADILTKRLPRQNFDELTSKLRLLDIYSPTWGGGWQLEITLDKL